MKDPFKDFVFPTEKEINFDTKRAKMSITKSTITKDQADYIWSKVWDADRSNDLYKQLASELNCALDAVCTVARGSHYHLDITEAEYDAKLIEWHKKYGYNKYTYILRSPGNDLLDYYDKLNSERPISDRIKLSPSEIFDLRFRKSFNNKKEARRYIKDLLISKGINVNPSMHDTYAFNTLSWLIDEPHVEYKFNSLVDLSKKICELTNRRFNHHGTIGHEFVQREMCWYKRDKAMAGWSVVKITNENS